MVGAHDLRHPLKHETKGNRKTNYPKTETVTQVFDWYQYEVVPSETDTKRKTLCCTSQLNLQVQEEDFSVEGYQGTYGKVKVGKTREEPFWSTGNGR